MSTQYQVIYPESVRETVRALLQRASEPGVRAKFVTALQTIDERLHSSPREYGDATNELERWTKYVRVQSPLFVHYAVSTFLHEGKHLVLISTIGVLSGATGS